MRPIARKLYAKISESGISQDEVLEFFEQMSPAEKKSSFPDDCLFQSSRYFAETILKELLRASVIRKDGSRYFKIEKKKDEEKK